MRLNTIALLVISITLHSCKQDTLSREEVTKVIDRFDRGWRNKDAQLVDSTLSPSYIYFTQSGGVVSRATVVQTAASPSYKLTTMARRQFDIVIEGNTAIVNTIWAAQGEYTGRAFNDSQRCSITVIKQDGQVSILSEHCAPIK